MILIRDLDCRAISSPQHYLKKFLLLLFVSLTAIRDISIVYIAVTINNKIIADTGIRIAISSTITLSWAQALGFEAQAGLKHYR